jgi:hypothetical protein
MNTNWRPPWYKALNAKLEGKEWLVNALLLSIILISIVLLLRGDRLSRTAWLVYLVSP